VKSVTQNNQLTAMQFGCKFCIVQNHFQQESCLLQFFLILNCSSSAVSVFSRCGILKVLSRVHVCLSVKKTGNKLSESCFTFSKQTIYREPCEKVRYAGRARGRHVPTKSDQKQHSKLTDKEGPTDNVDSTVPRKKAKQSESVSSLSKRSGADAEMLPQQLAADSRRPKSIMILPDADILEHEIAERQNPETESTEDMAEDLCIPKAARTDSSVEERSGYCLVMLLPTAECST